MAHAHLSNLNLKYFTQKNVQLYQGTATYTAFVFFQSAYSVLRIQSTKNEIF